MNKENITNGYFLYARKSSESDDRQIVSIDSQINELKRVAERFNLRIVDILSEAKSAKSPGRPVFDEMVERLKRGVAQGVICWKLDRLSRNPIDSGMVSWLLQEGIVQHIRTYDRDYYPGDNVLMMGLELSQANQFIRDLSQNTQRGLRAKAERGWYPGCVTIGYLHNPMKQKSDQEIVKDPDRFDLVRKMFDLMLTGTYTPPMVAKTSSRDWGLRSQRGGAVSRSNIYRILTDPFYAGTFEFPKGSGNWIEGKHEPMINRDEYDRIQILLKKKGHPRFKKHQFPYSGLMFCASCGAMITAEEKTKVQKNGNIHHYVYYRCTRRKDPNCKEKPVREEIIDKQISDVLNRITIPSEFVEWALIQLRRENELEMVSKDKIRGNLQKQYNNCVQKIKGLIDMRASSEITEEEFRGQKIYLSNEKERVQLLLNDLDQRIDNWFNNVEKLLGFSQMAVSRFQSGALQEKRDILSSFGSNLMIKDRKLSISLSKPLMSMEVAAKEVSKIYQRLEPLGMPINKSVLEENFDKSPILGG
ncbi:MAG: Recombinase [Parcubacteria group bacterium GW2011_GWB1_46_8]|nr:MAG: Recombinase [Parcubacteria group bacterium GW2011_GWF1_45_5]KKU46532.1 MAG: Recombinase [Parcubacteria group bacterium GW2011_GWB1_46_8]